MTGLDLNLGKQDNDTVDENEQDNTASAPTSDSGYSGGSAFSHDMLVSSGIANGREDEGNNEHLDFPKPLRENEDGKLVNENGDRVFTTNEQALADGDMVLDAKGRQPGIYLDDLEELQRREYGKAVEKAHEAANQEGRNSVVERQVNVRNSGMPPVTVMQKQEHPISGDAQDDDAEVPALENNPLPAE